MMCTSVGAGTSVSPGPALRGVVATVAMSYTSWLDVSVHVDGAPVRNVDGFRLLSIETQLIARAVMPVHNEEIFLRPTAELTAKG